MPSRMRVRVLSGGWWAGVLAASSVAAAASFPLHADPSGRYLVDARDIPFHIAGDAAWDLAIQVAPANVEHYLDTRAQQGFNTVLILFLEHKRWVSSSIAPATRDGLIPFQRPGDFSTPSDAYFQRVADVVERAGKHGFLVLATPLYLGFVGRDEGWWEELNAAGNTREVCRAFGEYLAHGKGGSFRGFKDTPNLIWVQGGDFFPPAGSEGAARAHALMDGLRAGGALQLQTGHWSEEHIATDQPDFAAAMELEAVYTYGANHDGRILPQVRRAYAHAPARPPHALPAFLIETQYESSGWLPPSGATRQLKRFWWSVRGWFGTAPPKITRPEEIRRLLYQAELSTVGGVVFGNEQVWMFGDEWADALATVGAQQMGLLGALMQSVHWPALVPSGLGVLAGTRLVAGSDDATMGGDVAAAAAADGTGLLAYVPAQGPVPRTVRVRGASVAPPTRARWFDPTSAATRAAQPTGEADGYESFTTPGANGAGDGDWVLLLDREPRAGR